MAEKQVRQGVRVYRGNWSVPSNLSRLWGIERYQEVSLEFDAVWETRQHVIEGLTKRGKSSII